MYQLELINKLLSQYKLFTVKLKSSSTNIKNNILQNDQSTKIEEKIMSIGLSIVFVYIVTGIVGLFGVYTGGFFVGLVLFIVGLLLSRVINKMVFGTPRTLESLTDEEKTLFDTLDTIEKKHISIRDKINDKSIIVNFTDYHLLKKEFDDLVDSFKTYSTRKLAIKYKLKHPIVVQKYKQQIKKFDFIYAHK